MDAAGRLVAWPDKKHLAELVATPVAVEGSSQVWAVPRAVPGGPQAPAVVHLLNRAYDASRDAMIPQRDLVVRLRRDLFGGRELRKATLHAPKAQPLPLGVSSTDDQVTLKVPELGKGDRYVLPERPEGGFAQNVPVPFSQLTP